MRRLWKISILSRLPNLKIQKPLSVKPKILNPLYSLTSLTPFKFLLCTRTVSSSSESPALSSSSSWPDLLNSLVGLFGNSDDRETQISDALSHQITGLRDELLKYDGDPKAVHRVLEEKGLPLLTSFSDGSAMVELLKLLYPFPQLGVEVFNWKRKSEAFSSRITADEYVKGIIIAGRARYVDVAVELFREAANNHVKTSFTYNALMSVYLSNGLLEKCQSLFQEFRRDRTCIPNVTTYNILLSNFGRLMLVNHMEATLQQIYASNLSPNVATFNNLIAGYIRAWMWHRMENAYRTMRMTPIEPDNVTYMLLIRGYSHSGNLKKMEEIYELVREHVVRDNVSLIRCMICAYCKNSSADRVEKIEALMKLIPEEQYSPWLTVLVIKVYAQEQLLEKMEKFIDVAFEHRTVVIASSVIRAIITAYYQFNAVDELAGFVKRAQCARWRLCRSVYHCKMVMYKSQNRLEEMENVLAEMEKFNISSRTKKTLAILYEAYSDLGPRCKLEQVAGLMCKHGFGIPMDYSPS